MLKALIKLILESNKNIDWDAQPLGKVSDSELARDLGVSPSTVLYNRVQR